MISIETIHNEFGFNELDEYFDLVFYQYEQTNLEECNKLFVRLSNPQRKSCINYFLRFDTKFCDLLKAYSKAANKPSQIRKTDNKYNI